MSLPWGSSSSSSAPSLPGGAVEIRINRFAAARHLPFFSAPSRFEADATGAVLGRPGAAYQIEVHLKESRPNSSGVRIVRASIDGREINEQLVLRGGSTSARFVGWLEDATGAKRIQFTFPPSGDATIQVGVFEATEVGKKGGEGKVDQAPTSARGASFAGPLVGSAQFALGDPVAIGQARLRAAA